ncbi:MAG: hypothetical protein HZB92_09545 [Euryarchaeota archaeon]|nr:hypothetical protein [Euryarchaeota archaeon]
MSSRTSSHSAGSELPPDIASLVEEAKACRLKDESLEKALGRVIRRKYGEGKDGYETYIKAISAYREMMDRKRPL